MELSFAAAKEDDGFGAEIYEIWRMERWIDVRTI